jgi:tetrahydromethanopterin S-methyltransferase subunit F
MSKKNALTLKVFGVAATGCILGSLAINHAIGGDGDQTEARSIEISAIVEDIENKDQIIAEKSATILDLETQVSELEELVNTLREQGGISVARLAKVTLENADLQAELDQLKGEGVTTPEVQGTDAVAAYLEKISLRMSVIGSAGHVDLALGSLDEIDAALASLDADVSLIAEGYELGLPEDQMGVLDSFRRAVMDHQQAVLPEIRDAFGPAMR